MFISKGSTSNNGGVPFLLNLNTGKNCRPALQTVVPPPYKGYFVPRLVEIGPVVISGEKYFQMLQLLFSHHLPLHGIAVLQDLEQTWIFFTQGYALCQVRLKLTP